MQEISGKRNWKGHQNNTSDVKILKNNLLDLVHDGIAMTSKEREEYASRGAHYKKQWLIFLVV